MKKTLLLTGLGIASCLTSFGQGYLAFTDSGSTAIYDNFSGGGAVKSPGNITVGILYSTTATSIAGLGTSATASGSAVSWAAINASGWTLATASGTPITAPTRTGLAVGTFSGGVVGLDGTSAGEVINLYVIAWASNGSYGSASALGWSNPVAETLGGVATPGLTLAGGMSGPVDVNPTVPEPATFALAGLGAAANKNKAKK